ncbi:ABC transporter substrate-binding protein [Telmatospirillum siberiense]|uniref:ABC transporter substrate-binding protein n=1 Tax=Telmatospirillum siberiense TaxID=382514 RepID=A0A2N3PNZ6_9PROT|nr:ABC transporter substrate-binding protein [Telmatospirillum siberiense]PKU22131.1 ABC transporter substrate-binding protein [Telmatospirillum siberiense]
MTNSHTLSRRTLMLGAMAASTGLLPAFPARAQIQAQDKLKPIKLAWNANAACLAPIPLAISSGLFIKHGLDIELINYVGSTDQLLESIATGKADAGVGMALRWLKPLEQGFDVKLTGGTHGGCLRLLAPKGSGLTADLSTFKGKTIATPDLGGPDRNFFSILFKKNGLDPDKDVNWRQYPADLLPSAVQKGEADALTLSDPLAWVFRKRPDLDEVATNLTGDYADRVCCVIGIRGSLLRDDRAAARALTLALLEAHHLTAIDYRKTAEAFYPYSPKVDIEDLVSMLKSHTHGHNPVGEPFKRELRLYAEDLKLVNVLKPTTDPTKYAEKIYADVLS